MMGLLAVRFLAELGMLACLGVGGWQLGSSLLASVVLGVVLPLVAAAVWARWIAPRASHRLQDPSRLGLEVILFVAALLAVLPADPSPAMAVAGLAVGAAFLASLPSRGHEAVFSDRSEHPPSRRSVDEGPSPMTAPPASQEEQ